MSQRERRGRMPREENPFMRLCYICLTVFGRDDLEIDEAQWYLKWRSEEIKG